ncbi:class I SAM-dependent methyltransferase [Rufibacter psychrotolerans]|uniref:class I SAM-dependent methyltransferase n=1 Tax=Rufibacter psychrotolerans TaxID=2812556 RepID=UPI0019689F35|nr:class I SAM-dependent methyltransferase [Rufibacter sp. SYSU D00308]
MSSPPAPDFNLIAPVYDALARVVFGKAQLLAQAHFLACIPAGGRVLLLGGGSGWILPELLKKSCPAQVLFLEASPRMVRRAQARLNSLSAHQPVEFRVGTQEDLLPHETFHVVITPFVLDLFTPDQALNIMQRLDRVLLPEGQWLHTDFHLSSSRGHRWWQKPLLWGMYRFFGAVSGITGKTLPSFGTLFSGLGYETRQEKFFSNGFIRAQVLQKSV